MTKYVVGAKIINHRVAGSLHVFPVAAVAARDGASEAWTPIRGFAVAAVLSGMLWFLLLHAI